MMDTTPEKAQDLSRRFTTADSIANGAFCQIQSSEEGHQALNLRAVTPVYDSMVGIFDV